MAHSMSRSLYRWLLYLHPPAFRQRFEPERRADHIGLRVVAVRL